jgi:probable HAF family extracellular repeat protein
MRTLLSLSQEAMKFKVLRIFLVLLFIATIVPKAQVQEQLNERPSRYHVIDLGTFGGTTSNATDNNNKGMVIGTSALSSTNFTLHAFLWRKGLMRDLGTLGEPDSGAFSQGFSVNERGEAVGFSDTSSPDPLEEDFCHDGLGFTCLPFLWRKGVMTPLPLLGGNNGGAFGINNRGEIVGQAENSIFDPTCDGLPQVFQLEPVLWQKGEARALPTLAGDPDGLALAVNDKGQVVGASGDCSFSFHALLWQDGVANNLGSLGGSTVSASDINNRGQVVGSSYLNGNNVFHAFLWQNGIMTDIDTVPGDLFSFASSINDRGQVVGTFAPPSSFFVRAFLWQNGAMADLNSLLSGDSNLFLLSAFGINSRGDIVGEALDIHTGDTHAYLATRCERNENGCELRASGTRHRGPLPENIRKLLQERRLKWYVHHGFALRPLR